MNRVREASTMSVPTMRQMLGLKKTASYWLIKKQWFDVLIIHGEMRVVISSFETWYANQTHYRKVNGPPPGEELRKKSYSVKDISNLLGIGIDTVYDLIHREKIPYSVYQYGQWRVDAAVFQFWYNSQCTYHLVTAEHPNELHKANLMKLTEFGRLLGLERDETYKLVRQLKYVLEIVSINRQLYVTMSSYQRWRETEMRTDAQIAASLVKRSRKELPQILPAVSSVEQESTSIPAQKFFTVPEAASFLHLSERTVYRLCSDGRIPAKRLASQWRIARTDLERLSNQNNSNQQGGEINGDNHL